MKQTKLILCFLILCSCSAQWHVKKALKKDPTLKTEVVDTLQFTQTVVDTIYNADSTFYIQERILRYDTIVHWQKYDFSGMKSWFQTWQENKTERTEIRQTTKVERATVKQQQKTERNKDKQTRKAKTDLWMSLFLIALAVIALGVVWIKISRK